MNNEFSLSEEAFQQRIPLIQRILLLYICAITPITLIEIVGLFSDTVSLPFIFMTIIDIMSIIFAVWTKQAKTQAIIEPRMKFLMTLYATSNILAVFTNHNAIFNLAGTIILIFTFLNITGIFKFAQQLGIFSFVILIILGMLQVFGVLDSIISSELEVNNLAVDRM